MHLFRTCRSFSVFFMTLWHMLPTLSVEFKSSGLTWSAVSAFRSLSMVHVKFVHWHQISSITHDDLILDELLLFFILRNDRVIERWYWNCGSWWWLWALCDWHTRPIMGEALKLFFTLLVLCQKYITPIYAVNSATLFTTNGNVLMRTLHLSVCETYTSERGISFSWYDWHARGDRV